MRRKAQSGEGTKQAGEYAITPQSRQSTSWYIECQLVFAHLLHACPEYLGVGYGAVSQRSCQTTAQALHGSSFQHFAWLFNQRVPRHHTVTTQFQTQRHLKPASHCRSLLHQQIADSRPRNPPIITPKNSPNTCTPAHSDRKIGSGSRFGT